MSLSLLAHLQQRDICAWLRLNVLGTVSTKQAVLLKSSSSAWPALGSGMPFTASSRVLYSVATVNALSSSTALCSVVFCARRTTGINSSHNIKHSGECCRWQPKHQCTAGRLQEHTPFRWGDQKEQIKPQPGACIMLLQLSKQKHDMERTSSKRRWSANAARLTTFTFAKSCSCTVPMLATSLKKA